VGPQRDGKNVHPWYVRPKIMHTWEEGAVLLMLFTAQSSLATLLLLLRGIPLRLGSMLHTTYSSIPTYPSTTPGGSYSS